MKIYTAEEHSRDKTVTPFALIACIIVHTRHVVVKANQIAPTKSTMKLKILSWGGVGGLRLPSMQFLRFFIFYLIWKDIGRMGRQRTSIKMSLKFSQIFNFELWELPSPFCILLFLFSIIHCFLSQATHPEHAEKLRGGPRTHA
jgi:hypothetical protein